MSATLLSYLYLLGAILFEIAGTTSIKLSQGLTRLLPSIAMFVFYAISFVLFSFSLKKIDVSVGYAIWSAVGTALIATIGVLYFKEPLSPIKIISLVLVILGVIGLNLSGIGD
ncbi:MAG TPA: multidrug efflux SMR transporter [Ktedonobacterales bacterium]|jgi:small multidrug resistance pump|nr:multidrug efflux SMR transporter [Ktedonobacterales bacterium]